ncbi:hypothetical protein DL897_07540 [Thermoflavimicrobium daqui]|jgi:competence protein ComGF|uniref:Prepilin-type N-terminal cleavage/methylation domain-containing protein n=2 Tax=Thermoflavimicrobium daqui TaxID=2137476 RepID=A0A364K6U9_9BACL|nr:hypothetical protein DL897_07540 [Thermoflavimicrobium daqui]
MKEQGFTYIELIISLSIGLLLIPAFYFCAQLLEKEVKQMMGQARLSMEYQQFLHDFQDEVKQGTNFRTVQGALLFDLPTGDTVRYELKKRQIIRSIKKEDEVRFQGRTILLSHVYFVLFKPERSGVSLEIGLQNWYADFEMKIFIYGRDREIYEKK